MATGSISSDAVALEALARQRTEELAALSDASFPRDRPREGELTDGTDSTHLTTIPNEFGFVSVHERCGTAGTTIDVVAEKQHDLVRFGPATLAAIAEHDHELFTEWIAARLEE
ncbi:hypothetical protein [Halostagnicola sp. A-GB9-2]|uniref:hypothetical protein n=1 Tax=Halostagnicola sp. A-GB9-2 TaxID=3048066 RepID=UPI0024C031D3|nr:hypothetical protein [Halostagnicola sp. A-GB9-2]MDJ1434217.1 hypothetical protein [Halostagnicola sp. A-GB9-2]